MFVNKNSFLVVSLLIFLTACASTGTKDFSQIQKIEGDMSTTVMFVGVKGPSFNAGYTPVPIEIDGVSIGSVKPEEMIRYDISPGSYTIKLPYEDFIFDQKEEGLFDLNIKQGETKFFEVYWHQTALGSGLLGELIGQGNYFGIREVSKDQWYRSANLN